MIQLLLIDWNNLFLRFRARAMEGGSELMEDIVFRGVEFSVKMEVDKGLLIVEISDSMTADRWTGEFDPACKWRIHLSLHITIASHSCCLTLTAFSFI